MTTSHEADISSSRRDWIVGPLGQAMSRQELPSPRGKWTPMRKAEVVAAVTGGLISIGEALALYDLSVEEFAGWQRAMERHGVAALHVTRSQHYRDLQERTQRLGWAA